MTLWIISILLFLIVLTFLYILIRFVGRKEQPTTNRLKIYNQNDQKNYKDIFADEELSKPIQERLIYPFFRKIADKLGKMTPHATYTMFEEKLADAGGFRGMTTNSFLLFWFATAFVITFLSGIVAGIILHKPSDIVIRVVIIAFVIAMLLPVLVLNRRIRVRQAAMQKSLPGILDLIYVSVQAGLSFDGAIAKVVEKMHGPLVEEFARMLQEFRVGVTRKDGLKNLSNRCKIQDISLFTAALIQADQLGVSIANVLKIQANNVRVKRQLAIREQALKAPVKILVPLVFLVFPALFVVLIGPAAIAILRQFVQQ